MKFDFSKIKDFDRHIELSIPNLSTLDSIFRQVTHQYAHPESRVIDFGCSTGRFLDSLTKLEGCDYVGVDEIEMNNQAHYPFWKGDIEDFFSCAVWNTNISVMISMFFLQFLGNVKRKRVMKLFKQHIDNGAVLLIAEKVYLTDPVLQQTIHNLHIQEKRKGFSDKEILDKDIQLSHSMFCKTETELEKELRKIGKVSKVWQSYNFMGYVVR
jgi:tRNA (cmo5U34)-methyltransferase|tara:strand:- start:55 stop:690 length:636 start_codon:yes stop_codon:yes gene_type:complete